VILEQICPKTQIRYFDKNESIVEQNKSNQFLYWILSGTVRVEKEIALIEHRNARHLVRPDTSDKNIKKYEKRIKDRISLGTLSTNQYFPEVLPIHIHSLDPAFDRFELIQKLSDLDQLGLNKSTITVTCNTPVECLVMDRIDFIRVMSWYMFSSMKREGFIFYVPVQLINKA
jgi:CRP-like cAMP-binding protein